MYERLVGLFVSDEGLYAEYRKAMMPILKAHGGGFGYDFKVSDVLANKSGNPINRVFTIYFPNEAQSGEFFANDEYVKIKERYFIKSVSCTTILAEYETSLF